eukprot:TRINITY_DN5415_c0_g1_i2.p1 TRINITY_DN5415_c0_g1~~TRINITY_DN5415_c0_g1_i2.p1  ORF type:complete len:514 (-),score=136.28 TRINITY_DN5415_c0_g1_i2:75-1616(-)
MAPREQKPLSEIKLDDIDFEAVEQCRDKNVLKRYLKLIEDDGNYFVDLQRACKQKLLEVAPKEYYLLYPRPTTAAEEEEAMRDILEWEAEVKEIDRSLQSVATKIKKDLIWDEMPGSKVKVPIRGQEPVLSRPNVQKKEGRPQLQDDKNRTANDTYARDKTAMRDYYSAWDKVDVDVLEEDFDRQEREAEEARKRHFDELRDEQISAHATTSMELGEMPDLPLAHRKHMADTEKEKGNEAFYSKDYEEAEAYYSRSLHYCPDDPSTWSNRALVRLKLEQPAKALQDCEHALALNSSYMKALHRKGKALYELQRYEEAVKAFQLALLESPGNTQINGDLMVARKKLRNEAPKTATTSRANDAEPTCRVEELDDDVLSSKRPVQSPAQLPSGYTRVQIEEDSESEDEEGDKDSQPSVPAKKNTPSTGFLKVAIEEVSGSEDEDGTAEESVQASSHSPGSSGFRKVSVVEESASEGSTPPAASASQSEFAPPPRIATTATESASPAGGGVSFDDMD